MKLDQLIREADEAEAQGLERTALVIPRRCSGYRQMRVLPGLLGEVACENTDGSTVVFVRIADLRAWLKRRGLPTRRLFFCGLTRAHLLAAMAASECHQ